MFDVLNGTPPTPTTQRKINRDRESRKALDDAINACINQMLHRMEEYAADERTRAMAGLARRHSDVQDAIQGMLKFSDPRCPVPVETINAASAVMDQVMTELTAFLKNNALPEKESSEIENT